mmetsp:Transcript_19490/g.49937  ORF Transcript_19490/g.49937 Transcript_19490/m.49937 type:complete len:247 (-) Transcript_19490:222-962(-)
MELGTSKSRQISNHEQILQVLLERLLELLQLQLRKLHNCVHKMSAKLWVWLFFSRQYFPDMLVHIINKLNEFPHGLVQTLQIIEHHFTCSSSPATRLKPLKVVNSRFLFCSVCLFTRNWNKLCRNSCTLQVYIVRDKGLQVETSRLKGTVEGEVDRRLCLVGIKRVNDSSRFVNFRRRGVPTNNCLLCANLLVQVKQNFVIVCVDSYRVHLILKRHREGVLHLHRAIGMANTKKGSNNHLCTLIAS